jgi:hypothetical protein
LQLSHVRVTADGLTLDEDLRDRTATSRAADKLLSCCHVLRDVDLFELDTEIGEQALGHIAVRAVNGAVDDDIGHGLLREVEGSILEGKALQEK